MYQKNTEDLSDRCSASLIIKEMQINATMKYTLYQSKWPSSKSLQTINAREGIEKGESSYTDGRNVNWYNQLWRTVWRSLKN